MLAYGNRVVDILSKEKTYRWPIAKLTRLLGEEVLDTSFPKGGLGQRLRLKYLNS